MQLSSSLSLRERLIDKVLLSIFRKFPPTDLIFKDPGPRALLEYQDEAARSFSRFFDRDESMFVAKDVLDLGSGFGGRSVRFAELGSRSVMGIEISANLVELAKTFADEKRISNVKFHVGSGECIPCEAEQFDLIVMYDVMEHVVCPSQVLSECWRVLRPGGELALVFPPYYAFRSGSHLHGYATSFPGLNLCFSTTSLKRAVLKLLESQNINFRLFFRDIPSDKLWNQNGLSVRHFHRIVKNSRFTWTYSKYYGTCDHRESTRTGVSYAWRLPLSYLLRVAAHTPLLREVFCERICAVLQK